MEVLGLIFSNIHHKEVFEATRDRTIASAPVGGRYRLIDFPLSNMVNAGVHQIGIVTKNRYQSLMDHIGSGKEWDLARKKGGLQILPPYGFGDQVYATRLEALKCQFDYIESSHAELVVLTDSYHICNIDYIDAFKFHKENGADITCIYHEHEITGNEFTTAKSLELDQDGKVLKMNIDKNFRGLANVSIDTWIMSRKFLMDLIEEAINTNYKSFNRDILARNVNNYKIYGYKHQGYYGNISDLNSYFAVNMDLIKKNVRSELFYQDGRAIYTKVRDSAPTKYTNDAVIENSIIADGCVIEGTVKNSVIFRGTRIKKGAIVENSILMQDTYVAENTKLDYVITDKNVKILNKKEMIGNLEELIYVKKGGVL